MTEITDIELYVEEPHCCICLSKSNIKYCFHTDKITHIPCTCNVYLHEKCFNKTDISQCIICKKPYQYTWGNYPDHELQHNCCYKIINFPYFTTIKKQYKACEYYCKIKNCCCWNMIVDFLFSLSLLLKFGLAFFLITYIFGYLTNFIWAIIFCNITDPSCFLQPNNGLIILLGVGGLAVCTPCFTLCNCCYEKYFKYHMTSSRVLPIQN